MTPLYHAALCRDTAWVDYVHQQGIPYGGTSAGAAIAAQRAVLGGWLASHNQRVRPILFKGASEGLEPITVRSGLGFVPFAIDVHASQMGTLTRLIHAVSLELVSEGWAVDEDTLIVVHEDNTHLFGQGQAYHVWQNSSGEIVVDIHSA